MRKGDRLEVCQFARFFLFFSAQFTARIIYIYIFVHYYCISEKCLCVLAYNLYGYECLAPRLRGFNFKYISFINVAYSSQTLCIKRGMLCMHVLIIRLYNINIINIFL
jgi:hypothetical protein